MGIGIECRVRCLDCNRGCLERAYLVGRSDERSGVVAYLRDGGGFDTMVDAVCNPHDPSQMSRFHSAAHDLANSIERGAHLSVEPPAPSIIVTEEELRRMTVVAHSSPKNSDGSTETILQPSGKFASLVDRAGPLATTAMASAESPPPRCSHPHGVACGGCGERICLTCHADGCLRCLADAEEARVAREDRLRALGFEELTAEQRKGNLALNVALREWPKEPKEKP